MRTDSPNIEGFANHLHFHNGQTCHGAPTLDECVQEAIKNTWTGKILERNDVIADGSWVKCYSMIVAYFDTHGKWGTYVAEVKPQLTMIDPRRQGAPNAQNRSVLQDWVHRLTFMQQSVLITACRGPDGIRKDHQVKVLIRYLRRCFLICAFDGKARWSPYEAGGGSFTGPLNLKGLGPDEGHLDKFIEIYLRHVDELPHHFQLHLMHASEIVGYKHPDSDVRGFWRALYFAIVKDAHLTPEDEATMDTRLGDREKDWRQAEQVIAEGSGTTVDVAHSAHRDREIEQIGLVGTTPESMGWKETFED